MAGTPPGWLQDPHGPRGQLRYWDGWRWTSHVATPTPPARMVVTSHGRSKPGLSGWVERHKMISIVVGSVAALVLIGAVGSAAEPEPLTTPPDRDRPAAADDNDAEPVDDDAEVEAVDETEEPAERPKRKRAKDSGEQHADEPKPQPEKKPADAVRTYLVTHVVDGDTIELGNGETVRLVGIDTPEVGECGYLMARDRLAALVQGEAVTLRMSDEDRDGYGRLLRYVDLGGMDAGLRLIKAGLAIARYDSRDGYGYHEREPVYIAADKAAPDVKCAPPPQPLAQPQQPQQPSNCMTGYSPCLPIAPDLDCADVNGPVRVTGSDPYRLDADGDGIGCDA